jgi:hypothetical protein
MAAAMKFTLLVLFSVLLALPLSHAASNAASDYCWNKYRSCWQSCCDRLGGQWSTEKNDCINYGDMSEDQLIQFMETKCTDCTSVDDQCIADYDARGGPPPSGGCCTGLVLLGIPAIALCLRKKD